MSAKLKREIALVWGAVLAAVNVVQASVSLPVWLHITIGAVSAFVAALGIRSQVVPLAKLPRKRPIRRV